MALANATLAELKPLIFPAGSTVSISRPAYWPRSPVRLTIVPPTRLAMSSYSAR